MDEELEQYLKEAKDIEDKDDHNKEIYLPEKDEEYHKKITLPPDHPLLEKFQQTLKQQLLNNIQKLNDELNEINIDIKKKTQIHDNLGVSVYEAQQIVAKQQETIQQCEQEIDKISVERRELEKNLTEIKDQYKTKKKELENAEEKDREIQNDIESMNYMVLQMQQWEDDLHSEVTIKKRVSEREKKDKKLFTKEKRNLDFMIYKLTAEIFRLEHNLEQCDMQLIAKEKEREELADLIAQSNVDQELLEAEQRRLMHSWNSVVVAINHRDNAYFAAKTDLVNVQEELRQVFKDIEIEKRISNDEMLKNEHLELAKDKIEEEKSVINQKLKSEFDRYINLGEKIEKLQAMLLSTTKDLEYATEESKMKENALNTLVREWEKEVAKKVSIEDKILALLQEQMSNDKVSKYMNKKIKELRELNRELDINLASLENQHAGMLVEVEKWKVENQSLQSLLNELEDEKGKIERELNKKVGVLHNEKFKILQMLRHVDSLSKKLEEAIAALGGLEISPLESKIKTIEKQIVEYEERNKSLQIFWLRQQNYVVQLSEKRQKQLCEINLLRKQILIMEQRNLKLEDELENLDMQERLMNREISNLQIKLDKFYSQTAKQKELKEELDKHTLTSQILSDIDLRKLELDCIKIETEIYDYEKQKEELSKGLLNVNRDVLLWEKKFQLANETKRVISEEKGSEGEFTMMQNEIHRMTVRLGQLKKAQEKLTQDLQFTLLRRESVWMQAESYEKRFAAGKTKTRVALQRKIQGVREKIKKCEDEKKVLEEKIHSSYDLEEEMSNDLNYTEREIEEVQQQIVQISKSIENVSLDKEKGYEKLRFLQVQSKYKASIDNKTYKMLHRSPEALEEDYKKELQKNGVLKNVLENLCVDFPDEKQFKKVYYILTLPME